jgi:transcription elongation factor GreA
MSVSTNHAASAPAVTEAGFHQLSAELEHLRTSGRAEVAEHLREARADGDLPDNPALLDTLEAQAKLEYRIAVLAQHLAMAQVTATEDGTAGVGCNVAVADLDTGEEMRFQLVGELEADASLGRVSIESPIGKAIHGLRPGTIVSAETPRGIRRMKLLEVQSERIERRATG